MRSGDFPRLFEEQVRRTPQAPAVCYAPRPGAREEISYETLDARANQLARLLVDRGVGPEKLVAVAHPRHPDLVVSALAVLKAGAAFVPLDLEHPAARLATVLTAGPGLLLTGARGVERLGGRHQVPLLRLDQLSPGEALATWSGSQLTDAERCGPLRLDHPAYVIHTSGSTGRPKGVVVTHRGVADLFRLHRDRLAVGPGDRVLQYASPAFDAAFWELCLALLHGATLVMAPAPDLRPGAGLGRVLTDHQITHLTLTPSALDLITEPAELAGVRTLVVAGERVTPRTVGKWVTQRTLLNAYGPTESTVCATLSEALTAAEHALSVPIGQPVPGTSAHVLGAGLEEVPPGVTGELYLAGAGLARGYLDGPGLTAERFVAHPFGPPGARMYRTGDLAHWDTAGQLHFDGRVDDQLKVHGSRVEPAEIEAVLATHPDVSATAVTVASAPGRGARITGHVVVVPGGVPSPAALRAWLAERLPGYMVPAVVREVPALPLTTSGKLDRGALAAAEPHTLVDSVEHGSRTALLCALAAEVLGTEVGPDDGFFDRGGTSMDAVALTGRVHETLGVEIAVATVFEQQTMAGIERAIDRLPQTPPLADGSHHLVWNAAERRESEAEHPPRNDVEAVDHQTLLRGLFPGRTSHRNRRSG